MPSVSDWKVPSSAQPKPEDYGYDLEQALAAVVGLRATVPADAFTAETLGTERAGNGVFIRGNGLVLTIGYLITEAETIWLTLSDGRSVPGHVLGYDQETGFGLVQALAKLDMPALKLGQSAAALARRTCRGRRRRRAASIGRRAHRRQAGIRRLLGIRARRGDLHRAGASELGRHGADRTAPAICSASARCSSSMPSRRAQAQNINMVVPIDLLKPILDDLMKFGRRNTPPRPWLGLYATEVENRLVIVGLADRGPAKRADLRTGDIVLCRRRQRSARPRRLLPPRLGARQGRRRSAAAQSIATATRWSFASSRASATVSSRGRACIDETLRVRERARRSK